MDDEVLTLLADVMQALWRSNAEWPNKPCSLARLSKQAGRPMSVLRRQLTMLEEAGLVDVALDEGGVSGTVAFTPAGRQMAMEIFG